MTWPITPLTTYAADVQIKSADLNAIQIAINILHASVGILGQKGRGASATYGTDGSIITDAGGSGAIIIPIELPVGFKIGTIHVVGLRTGANNPTYTLFEEDNAAGGATDRGNVAGTSASRETLTLTANYTLLVDKTYYLKAVGGTNSTATVFMIKVTPAA